MKYMWSKRRIAKYLLPIILEWRKEWQRYIEPFVWWGNMIENVSWNRIWWDINEYNILLFKWLQNWEIPQDECLFRDYLKTKFEKKKDFRTAFIWYWCAYWGQFFWTYARWKNSKWEERNYCLESKNNIMKQKPKIEWVEFYNCSYDKLEIPNNSIIYCDPPYKNVSWYDVIKFNHNKFWKWCRDMTNEWHKVFISEYNAPYDFECIWEKEVNNPIALNSWKKAIERLYTY